MMEIKFPRKKGLSRRREGLEKKLQRPHSLLCVQEEPTDSSCLGSLALIPAPEHQEQW